MADGHQSRKSIFYEYLIWKWTIRSLQFKVLFRVTRSWIERWTTVVLKFLKRIFSREWFLISNRKTVVIEEKTTLFPSAWCVFRPALDLPYRGHLTEHYWRLNFFDICENNLSANLAPISVIFISLQCSQLLPSESFGNICQYIRCITKHSF